MRALGYFDEQNWYLGNDEHDFFARAWFQHGWVAGFYPTHFDHLPGYGQFFNHFFFAEDRYFFVQSRKFNNFPHHFGYLQGELGRILSRASMKRDL